MRQSPFALSRFEYGHTHLYYLPADVFQQLEGEKPIYLIGSRGTGKTTLLTALSWREQVTNPNLKKQLKQSGVRGYVGVYLRMPSSMVGSLEASLKFGSEALHALVFAYYVDLLWLEELTSILAEIFATGKKTPSISAENATVRNIIERYECLSSLPAADECRTLRGLTRVLHAARSLLERELVVTEAGAQVSVCFPPGQVGEFGRFVASQLTELHRKKPGAQNTYLKVCFDEAECLSPFQQRVMNTMVRLSSFPVFFVISYVRSMDEMSTTLIPKLTLQDADRAIIHLDGIGDESFRLLCEGVVATRIAHQLGRQGVEFSTRALLGSLSINSLLFGMLKDSTSEEARALLKDALILAATPPFTSRDEVEVPPIYQAFLLGEGGVLFQGDRLEPWRIRGQDSAELRKKMVVAYLLICKRFRFKLKYASADMLLQMSDKCVRDYLSQMNSVFTAANKDLVRFLESPVPIDIQADALLAASVAKRQFIPESGVSAPEPTILLVDSLAMLTAQLQTEDVTGKSLASTERGRFVVDFQGRQDSRAIEAQRLISEAAEAGFLKLLDSKNNEWVFRVHCSLAATYGFSYRGAYYPISLGVQDLMSLYDDVGDHQRKLNIERLSGTSAREMLTLPLFEAPR